MSKSCNKDDCPRRGVLDILATKTILPSDALAEEFRIEMRGRHTLYLHGCRRIIKYSPEKICFAAKGFSVNVEGIGLICSAYHAGTVTVDGFIENIAFDSEGTRGEQG